MKTVGKQVFPFFLRLMQGNIYLQMAGATLLFGASCSGQSDQIMPSPPLAVRTAQVGKDTVQATVRYVGTVHSHNEIIVLARMAGRLAELPASEGQVIDQGEVIARIVAPETSARVDRLRAEVARLQRESEFVCSQADVDEQLSIKNAISRVAASASRLKCESARGGLAASKASLRESDVMATYAVEKAPFTGTILKWMTKPGENVMPGRPVLQMGDPSLEILVRVNEKDIAAGIGLGTRVILEPDGKNSIITRVSEVAPLAVGRGRTVEVRIPLKRSTGEGFRHGQSVDVAFVIAEQADSKTVPIQAVVNRQGADGVFRVVDRKARWVAVKTSVNDRGVVAVEGALKPGDQIVTSNLDIVTDQMALWPVSEEGEAP